MSEINTQYIDKSNIQKLSPQSIYKVGWTADRMSKCPLDLSSVKTMSELTKELDEECYDNVNLYPGQFIGIEDSENHIHKAYYVTVNNSNAPIAKELTFAEDHLALKGRFDGIANNVNSSIETITNSVIDSEEIMSLAVTYIYTYCASFANRMNNIVDTFSEEIDNTHRLLVWHNSNDLVTSYNYANNIDNTWVSADKTHDLNYVIKNLLDRINTLENEVKKLKNNN